MLFKLEFVAYGVSELTYLSFKDVMPCVLEFWKVIDSTIEIDVYVSEDLKTVWFNMTEGEALEGDVVVTIVFAANVTGITGTGGCCEEAYNRAWLFLCECQEADFYAEVNVVARKNSGPYEPSIVDDAEGAAGEELTFNVTGTDPDGDELYYCVNWGDETEEWFGPYPEDTEVEVTHEWSSEGAYLVKVKSRDEWGEESTWSDEVTVTISGDLPPDLDVTIDGFRGVTVTLTNNMDTDIVDIDWDLEVHKRFLGRDLLHDNGTIELLEGGNSTEFGGLTKIGFGPITVKVSVNASGMDLIEKTWKGFILGRFVLFLR
jgi:hypothetical protein